MSEICRPPSDAFAFMSASLREAHGSRSRDLSGSANGGGGCSAREVEEAAQHVRGPLGPWFAREGPPREIPRDPERSGEVPRDPERSRE
eukprot:3923891-Prymnesium_polylepis.1